MKKKLHKLIAKDKIEKTFVILETLDTGAFESQVSMQFSIFKDLRESYAGGLITEDEYEARMVKVRNFLQVLVEENDFAKRGGKSSNFSLPKLPSIKIPSFSLPSVKIPSFKLPTIKMPSIKAPSIKIPSVKLPSIKMPSVKMPSLGALGLKRKASTENNQAQAIHSEPSTPPLRARFGLLLIGMKQVFGNIRTLNYKKWGFILLAILVVGVAARYAANYTPAETMDVPESPPIAQHLASDSQLAELTSTKSPDPPANNQRSQVVEEPISAESTTPEPPVEAAPVPEANPVENNPGLVAPTEENTALVLLNLNTLKRNFKKVVGADEISIKPTSSLQGVYQAKKGFADQPLILEFTLKNEGSEPAKIQEVQLLIEEATLDQTPCLVFKPQDYRNSDLVLDIYNHGWGPTEVTELKVFNQALLDKFKIDGNRINWAGTIEDRASFIIPSEVLNNWNEGTLLSKEELGHIKQKLDPSRSRTASGKNPNLDFEDREARELYLKNKQAVGYADFKGQIKYKTSGTTTLSKEINWGNQSAGFYDLLFTDSGFYVAELNGSGAPASPTYNYDASLSISDKSTTKSLKIDQEIPVGATDKVTVTIEPKESARYKIKIKLRYNEDKFFELKKQVDLNVIKFNKDTRKENIYIYNGGKWVKTR